MSITQERKQSLISQYSVKPEDTGSPEVQCSLLTERIINLTAHFKIHKKDFSTGRGLLKLVGQRRRLLNYLKTRDLNRYKTLIERLGLRK